jgi:hypothetical protein
MWLTTFFQIKIWPNRSTILVANQQLINGIRRYVSAGVGFILHQNKENFLDQFHILIETFENP